jgi:tetratricopeptide (TPR) repeat protein
MGLFRADAAYDRAHVLDAAARARAKKRRTRAIELYRWALAVEPRNLELQRKLAPLLAQTGQHFDAWCSFKTLARECLRAGDVERALAVYREATLFLPREIEAWQAVARLQHRSGHPREALDTLVEGSRHFHPRWLRPQAIFLLRRAREIDAWNFEVVLEMALLLAGSDQKQEAAFLLRGLAERSNGERLSRVRAAQVRVEPGPRAIWQWLRDTLRPGRPRARAAAAEPERPPARDAATEPERPPARDDVATEPAPRSAVVPLRAARRA